MLQPLATLGKGVQFAERDGCQSLVHHLCWGASILPLHAVRHGGQLALRHARQEVPGRC